MIYSWSSGYPQILIAGIGFGFLGYFQKQGLALGMTTGQILSFRFTVAAILLWSLLTVYKKKLIFLSRIQIIWSVLLGVFGYAIFSTLYFLSLEGLSMGVAAILLFTFPLFVNLGEVVFLKHKMRPAQWLHLGLALLGMGILVSDSFEVQNLQYAIYAVGAAVTYAIYVLISGQIQKNVEPLSSSLYVITAAAFALLLFHRPPLIQLLYLQTPQWIVLFGIAIVSTVVPITFFLAGLQKMTGSQASLIVMVEPVVAALIGFVLLDEALSWTQVLGSSMILSALVLNSKASAQHPLEF